MIVENVLDIFQGFRMPETQIDQYESVGKAILRDKLSTFISNNKPIDFAMLGFPFKSTNDVHKVLGKTPDLAEQATLDNFDMFNKRVKEVYEPGVKIHMVSDGYVFNDILGVEDKVVEEYNEISKDMASDVMHWYDLNMFFEGSLSTKREKLNQQFGITPEKLQHDILFNPDVNYLYNGMSRFMFEELAKNSYPSRNQHQKAAKALSRQMMFRNEAYSGLVRKEFAHMIRISMHPSVNNGAKYSFQLIPSKNAKHSAWHCAIVVEPDGSYTTIHKIDAINNGYELVNINGKPNHFINNKAA